MNRALPDSKITSETPDARYWPDNVDTVEVACPLCGERTQSVIGSLKASGEPGRAESCHVCQQDFIVEAFAHGIVASREEVIPFRVALTKAGIEKLKRVGFDEDDLAWAVYQIENQLNGKNGHIVDETGPWYVGIDRESSMAMYETDIRFVS